MNLEDTAHAINVLSLFCGMRDIDSLTGDALAEKYGFARADVMVLFGGSIIAGGDEMAAAINEGIAKKYVIVGGVGHTTETLRARMKDEHPEFDTDGLSEAECFQNYLKSVHGVEADYLETKSTNCGNNITNLLELLKENSIEHGSIILMQDATMQRRMDAGMRRYAGKDTTVINYASYRATTVPMLREIIYLNPPHGMWRIERFVNLLMGEIPRLRDEKDGYGPKGKNYIAHVDIPDDVEEAFSFLQGVYGSDVREANPLYSSK